MSRYLLLAAATAFGLATSVASAADMYVPRKAPAYAPLPAPAFTLDRLLRWFERGLSLGQFQCRYGRHARSF